MNTESKKQMNPNMHYLWWVNQNTKKRFCAGRAFYSEKTGDFSLCINLLETSSGEDRRDEFYLRPVKVGEDFIQYRLDKVIYRNGRSLRVTIGEAIQNRETHGDIHLHIEPLTNFYKKLVINLTENREVKSA